MERTKIRKQIGELKREADVKKVQLSQVVSKLGHYSCKNVFRREKLANEKIRELQAERDELKKQLDKERNELSELKQETASLMDKVKVLEGKVNNLNHKLRLAQRKVSYHRIHTQEINSMYAKCKREKHQLQKRLTKCHCQEEEEDTKEVSLFPARVNGILSDEMRLCIAGLVGLDVSAENVGLVNSEVLSAAGIEFDKKDLPSRQAVITVTDESHFLMKHLYAEKLDQTEFWGINKDGTSRQKKKILTSTLTLADGQELPLGFRHVARETSERIKESVQQELEEIATVKDFGTANQDASDDFLADILSKLTSLMGDRAANEKKANQLLTEWRDSVLQQTGSNSKETQTIHSFYCMAHALLGFHTYSVAGFSEQQREYSSEDLKLGRENSAKFNFFKKEFPVLRSVRMAAEVLGPVGDEKSGAREKWLAHCRIEGKKSLIQSYRDNRFNGLFETAAQVHHHRHDIQAFLQKFDKPNMKLLSVHEDLKDPRVRSMIHAVAVVYVLVTGPYWDLVNSKDIPYLQLHEYIQPLADTISVWKDRPAEHMEAVKQHPIFGKCPPNTHSPLYESAMSQPEDIRFFSQTLSSVLHGVNNTIMKQLRDFLPGEKYGQASDPSDVERTKHASLTNLTCERQFGSLDSSQNRRRHATLHYHTTVSLLKSHRQDLKDYLEGKGEVRRKSMWKLARRGGRFLRRKHQEESKSERQEQEKDFEAATLKTVNAQKKTSMKRKRANQLVQRAKQQKRSTKKASIEDFSPPPTPKLHDWVAVAYDNGWYPGQVIDVVDASSFLINFLHPSTVDGQFKYPARPDQATVTETFIFASPLVPPTPASGGRLYMLQNVQVIVDKYNLFKKSFFT